MYIKLVNLFVGLLHVSGFSSDGMVDFQFKRKYIFEKIE